MGLFRRKKQEPEKEVTYVDWEKELGFLDVLVRRELNIIRNIFSDLQATDEGRHIDDERVSSVVTTSVGDVVAALSPKYLDFLGEKYFDGNDEVIKYITNTLYIATMSDVLKIHDQRNLALLRRQQFELADQKIKEMNEIKEE